MSTPHPVILVGAGLAGLACAVRLRERGIPATLLEASNHVGGRVATDECDGFLLDRGFQVLLTAYPETARLLDYSSLRLADYHAGAKVFAGGKLHTLGDPTRHPADALPTLRAAIGTLADKARIVRLRARVTAPSLETMLAHPEQTTEEYLRADGFSAGMRNRFFRPFLGGIFLENQLVTSSRKFEFVFRMFAQGKAALPEAGMNAIPRQLAARLDQTRILTNHKVLALEGKTLHLENGASLQAETIVLACEETARQRILQQPAPTEARTIACVYFAATQSPIAGPWLVLNGEGRGPVNNVSAPSQVQRSYAPTGQTLVSVSVIDPEAAVSSNLETAVRAQLRRWFGAKVEYWRHLRTYRIPHPVPYQTPPALQTIDKPAKLADGLYSCGDDHWIASIEGAIRSGIAVAGELAH